MNESGREFLGVPAVRRQRRDGRPKTRAPRRRLDPEVARADVERRKAELGRLVTLRGEYHAARKAWLSGTRPAVFPEGATQLRGFPGVVVRGHHVAAMAVARE